MLSADVEFHRNSRVTEYKSFQAWQIAHIYVGTSAWSLQCWPWACLVYVHSCLSPTMLCITGEHTSHRLHFPASHVWLLTVGSMGGIVRRLEGRRKEKPGNFCLDNVSASWCYLLPEKPTKVPAYLMQPWSPCSGNATSSQCPVWFPAFGNPKVASLLLIWLFFFFPLLLPINQLPMLNSLYLSYSLVCVLLVEPWLMKFPFKYRKFPRVHYSRGIANTTNSINWWLSRIYCLHNICFKSSFNNHYFKT